jgi:hypothetical protein
MRWFRPREHRVGNTETPAVTPLPEPAEPVTTDDYQAEWFTLGGDEDDDCSDAGPFEFGPGDPDACYVDGSGRRDARP